MQIGLQYLIGGQKVNISCFSDESCILDVTWEVVYCSKRYLLSIHSQHDGSEDDDGIDGLARGMRELKRTTGICLDGVMASCNLQI